MIVLSSHRTSRLAALAVGALTATTLAIPVVSPVTAEAQTCADGRIGAVGGTWDWGIRESWRSYIRGNVAKGDWTTESLNYDGSAFNFTPTPGAATIEASKAVIPFDGSVHFTGHSGKLDTKMSDFKLIIEGNNAGIQVDYDALEFVDTETMGPRMIEDDQIIATVSLDQAFDGDAATVNLSGSTSFTPAGLKLFGGGVFYDITTELDNSGGTLNLGTECGARPVNSAGQTGITASLKELNSAFSETNTLLSNTTKLLGHVDTLFGPEETAASASTGVKPSTGGTTAGTTGGTGGGTAAGAAAGTGAGTGAGAAGAPTGSGDVCTADSSRGVTQAQALWGVRQSFRKYINGGIAKGGWELTGIGEQGSEFVFSGNSGAIDPAAQTGTILFPGMIRFTGHSGTLDTRFSNIEIQFNGTSGALVADVTSNSVEGVPNDYGRTALAQLNFSALDLGDTSASGTAQTILTQAGSQAFGDFYPAGDALDPISFTATLGGAAACAAGQGAAPTAGGSSAGGSSGGAAKAAALKAGGAAATPGALPNSGGTTTSAGLQAGSGDQFRIKAAGENAGLSNDRVATMILLLVAAFIVAGGSLSGFVRRHPTMGGQ